MVGTVCRACLDCRELSGKQHRWEEKETTHASRAQVLLPDDCCPKASSLGCVGEWTSCGRHSGSIKVSSCFIVVDKLGV